MNTEETNQRPSQAARILTVLQVVRGEWVGMPVLVRASGAYAVHSRISELRSDGHMIEQRTIRGRRGTRCQSFYRLTTAEPIQL